MMRRAASLNITRPSVLATAAERSGMAVRAIRATQRLAALLLVLFVLALGHTATAAEIAGRVVGITDGDTLNVLDEARRQTRVRLAEIDAPESHQPYGNRAKQALSELVFGRDVRVVVVTIDRYGRTVGRIYAGSTDVSAEMVRQGAAWVYRKYNRDPSPAPPGAGGAAGATRPVGSARGGAYAAMGMACRAAAKPETQLCPDSVAPPDGSNRV